MRSKAIQRGNQFGNPFSRYRRHREDGRLFQERLLNNLSHFLRDQLQEFAIHKVYLSEYDETFLHPQKSTDIEVLPRLRHHAFIGRDDKGDKINAPSPGHHLFHKSLMTGYIDDPQTDATGQVEKRESQLNRNSSLFFFLQPIGVDSRQRFHEGSLPVINMACRPENDLLLFTHLIIRIFPSC